jgi:polysaccharide export outer membrane protein
MGIKAIARGVVFGLLPLLPAAMVGAEQSGPAATTQNGPKVVARDKLVVTVWGIDIYSGTFTVAPDGTMDFPDLGRVSVGGLTGREIETLMAARLKTAGLLLDPQVTVQNEQSPTKQVTVSGAVLNPGVISYAGELTVFDAVIRAGQATQAAGEEILVLRAASTGGGTATAEPAQSLTVNLKELRQGNLSHNVALQNGDHVIILEAEKIYVHGYVRSPGEYAVTSGMTVEQALALAGGITERGSDRRIEIKRRGVEDPLKGVKLTDLVQAGDTIKVNRSIM